MTRIDWSAYARQYDLMAEINPAYQELVAHCVGSVKEWQLPPGAVVADLCAGTGNVSISLARSLPWVTVLHVELDDAMLERAVSKARRTGVSNWQPVQADVESGSDALPKLAGVIAIHCIYTFKDPCGFIARICQFLNAGGYIYACDLGRVLALYDWASYLLRESVAARGVLPTLALLPQTNLIRQQNRLIAEAQRSGAFWTHDLARFRAHFENSGVQVTHASNALYRGYDDLVIGRKPLMNTPSACDSGADHFAATTRNCK